jgi:hypothetical protein
MKALVARLLFALPTILFVGVAPVAEASVRHHRVSHLKIAHAKDLPPPGQRVKAPEYHLFDPRDAGRGKRNAMAVVAVILFAVFLMWYKGETKNKEIAEGSSSPRDKPVDAMQRTEKSVEEDTYGFALASLIRDTQQIAAGSTTFNLRATRIFFALGLLLFTTCLQMFIMYFVKNLVIAKWVTNIRDDYSRYQEHMYEDTFLNVNGKHRGVDGTFMPGNIDTLEEGLKGRVCNIAFSQSGFFGAVLLIWTLTVIAELRNIIALFRSLVVNTRNIKSMEDALLDCDPDIDDDDPRNGWIIDGLTISMKVAIMLLVIIPRLVLTIVLLWLGCRFLAATNDFGEMVLNAIALEFILMLKDLLYSTIVPDRNKREIEHINIRPSIAVDHASYWTYLGTFTWLIIAFAWIVFYVFHFQMVLPLYKWDVKGPCTAYIKERYYDGPTTNAPTFLAWEVR